jgi:hypothetical protein
MNIHKTKYFAVIAIVILVVVSAVALTKSGITNSRKPTQEEKRGVDKPPMITSCVKNIKILKKEMTYPDSPTPLIAVKVENTGDVGIIAISLDSVKDKIEYSVMKNTFEAETPLVIIEPHGTRTLTIEATNISPGAYLQIGAVTYVDGTEEGCDASLELMRESKKRHEKKKAEKKESL